MAATGAPDRTLRAMAMGKRKSEQAPLWIPTTELPVSPGHPFYRRLNEILDAAGFDRFVEEQCRPFYAPVMGRPSLAPGRYFRLLLIGYFEGLDSERGIAWRAADSPVIPTLEDDSVLLARSQSFLFDAGELPPGRSR